MPVIKPSLKFEGSDLNLVASSAPYIKEGVRRAIFNKTTNQEGAYLYFLPAYKADTHGNGVWYKKITIRDNFGTNFKEKYYVPNRADDPAEYFSNNFRILYSEESKPRDEEINGRKFKKYPNHGRLTDRVIYNVAFAQNLGLGAHVLDLPLRNGADILNNWLASKDLAGNNRQPINDPDQCFPVFVKLKENSANPWVLQIDSSQPVQLPPQLANSDYFYNLDDIFTIKSKEEIIAKLREMYSSSVFEDCMNGYDGLTKGAVSMRSAVSAPKFTAPSATSPNVPEIKPVATPVSVPAIEIPKATIVAPAAPINPPPAAEIDISSLPPNPMASAKLSREEALKFINAN